MPLPQRSQASPSMGQLNSASMLRQSAAQPSFPAGVMPSSHASPGPTSPSPQRAQSMPTTHVKFAPMVVQSPEQPSPLSEFRSSQTSPVSSTPLPQRLGPVSGPRSRTLMSSIIIMEPSSMPPSPRMGSPSLPQPESASPANSINVHARGREHRARTRPRAEKAS
jgi:hypothetical protein